MNIKYVKIEMERFKLQYTQSLICITWKLFLTRTF